jgi:hypothetical protein
MSYQWLGEKNSNKNRYPSALYDQYKSLDKIAPYKDALYTFITIDPKKEQLKIEGLKSEWLAPSPIVLNVPNQVYGNQYSPIISDRTLNFNNHRKTRKNRI